MLISADGRLSTLNRRPCIQFGYRKAVTGRSLSALSLRRRTIGTKSAVMSRGLRRSLQVSRRPDRREVDLVVTSEYDEHHI